MNRVVGVHAQELFAEPTAPTTALGIYYLCLPVLLILGILVLSSAAVYLLVPIARRYGFHFNEVGSVGSTMFITSYCVRFMRHLFCRQMEAT